MSLKLREGDMIFVANEPMSIGRRGFGIVIRPRIVKSNFSSQPLILWTTRAGNVQLQEINAADDSRFVSHVKL